MSSSSSSATSEMHLPSPPSSDSSLSSLSNASSPKDEEESNEFFSQLASQLDPFSYLLHPDAMATDDLIQSPSVNEWSPFTSLADNGVQFPQSKVEAMGFGGEFNFAMPMDLGLESNFIDPSALHFTTSIFTQPDPSIHPFGSAQTEFNPPSLTQLLDQNGSHPSRRLSVTSSSSSSGASLSPVLERQPPPDTAAMIPTNSHEELAQKVLQAIGATFTVSSNASNLATGTFPRFQTPFPYQWLCPPQQLNPNLSFLASTGGLPTRRLPLNRPSSLSLLPNLLPRRRPIFLSPVQGVPRPAIRLSRDATAPT